MKQLSASFLKGIKDLFMSKPALFWTIAWPLLWFLLSVFVFLKGVPESQLALEKGRQTISMSVFSIMIAGMSNIPATISEDRQRGLFLKLKSMPVQPWKESAGRVLSILFFSLVSIILVFGVGISIGARFDLKNYGFPASVPLIIFCMLVSTGVGLIIGTFIKNMQGSIMTGVGIAVVTSAISGIFFPHEMLPRFMQVFSDYWPISSINNLLIYFMAQKDILYSSPAVQYLIAAITSTVIFAAGIWLYSVFAWRSE